MFPVFTECGDNHDRNWELKWGKMVEGLCYYFLFLSTETQKVSDGLETTKSIFELKNLNSTTSRESGEWEKLGRFFMKRIYPVQGI